MNFFKSIVLFFKKDNVQSFLKLVGGVLKMVAGSAARDLQKIAEEEVLRAEESGKTGTEKLSMAFKAVKKRLPEVGTNSVNLAIELAVATLIQAKG